jgi:cell division GTPase FtsZ
MLAVNSDSKQLDKLSAKYALLLSSEGDERLMPIIDTHDLIIVISGAGGIGERVTRKIINHCHLAGKTLIPVLFKPFEFEGIKRNMSFQNLALEALALNGKVLTVDSQEAYEQGSSDKSFLTIETELNELCMNLIRQFEEL